MNHIFHQNDYAEDQANAHNILTLHVIGRGLSSGAVLGIGLGALSRVTPYRLSMLKSAAYGSLAGAVGLAFALNGLMTGKDEIEWQDRSWRLLNNQTQNLTDLTTVGGSVLGAAWAATRKQTNPRLLWRVLGGASIGNALGLFAGFASLAAV